MNNHSKNYYKLEELMFVRFNDNYKEYLEDKEMAFFLDSYYAIERLSNNDELDDNITSFYEFYTDVITGCTLFSRSNSQRFKDYPDFIAEIKPLPEGLLTEEEKQKGEISNVRVFQIFQILNRSLTSDLDIYNQKVLTFGAR